MKEEASKLCPIARGVKLKALLGGRLASKHAEAIEYKLKKQARKSSEDAQAARYAQFENFWAR